MLLPANLEVALHDRQPSREQRLADGHAVLELVPRVEEALLVKEGVRGDRVLDRVARSHPGSRRAIRHADEVAGEARLLGRARDDDRDHLADVVCRALREQELVLLDRPHRVAARRRHVGRRQNPDDTGRFGGLDRVDGLDRRGRLLRGHESRVQPPRRQRRVVGVLGRAAGVPRARQVRKRLPNHPDAARLGRLRLDRRGDARRRDVRRGHVRLEPGVAGVRVPLRAAHRRLWLEQPGASCRPLRRVDHRRRRSIACRTVLRGAKRDGGGDEGLEDGRCGERGPVLWLPARRRRADAQLVDDSRARLLDALRIPRPANQRRRRLARHHHGRREAAEREARVRHHVHAAGRLQADAQPGGHDGDVVLAAARLLVWPHEVERRAVRHEEGDYHRGGDEGERTVARAGPTHFHCDLRREEKRRE
mmetsp:Transcript_24334/g.78133  ORF Transcript_24334/g.78133 Transcript_24334/m.78133 type:complete len:422 (-) Transcript_24334:532-1797(-)